MSGGARAVETGEELVSRVASVVEKLNLKILNAKNDRGRYKPYRVGYRIWGAKRYIDLVLCDPSTRKILGIECKSQGGPGSVAEKIPGTIQDIGAWPFSGIVVFDGDGYESMKPYLFSTGKAIEFPDLEGWLKLFFGLEL